MGVVFGVVLQQSFIILITVKNSLDIDLFSGDFQCDLQCFWAKNDALGHAGLWKGVARCALGLASAQCAVAL